MDHASPLPTVLKVDRASDYGAEIHWSDRRRQNLSLPISKLPSEILSSIFFLGVFFMDSPCPAAVATRLSQVSHSWRMVALGCSSLWGRVIDFARAAPEWTEELLRRVGESPIDLNLQSESLTNETLARALQHFRQARIFSLFRWPSSSDVDSILTTYLAQQAPHVEQFILRFMGARATSFLLPSNFGECLPSLRLLELQGCNVDFRLPLFQRLEILFVYDIKDHRAPTAAKWLDILANMPLLARVWIASATSDVHENILSTAHLPNLKKLSLSSSLLVSAAIICNLIHPDTTNVALFCTDATSGVDLERLFVKLSRHMSLSNSRSHNPSIDVTIKGMCISVRNWWGYGCLAEGRVSIALNHMSDMTRHPLIAATIAAFGSIFQEATSLEFEMGLDLTVSDSEESLLLDLLRKFERVELLSFPFDWRIFAVLQRTHRPLTVSPFDVSKAEAERDVRILFPLLRKLRFWSIFDVDCTQVFQNLIPILRHRSSIGASITTLYREDFKFDVQQTRLLKELGLQVYNYMDDENEV